MRLPLAELLSSQFAKILQEKVRAAAYVEPSQIAGVPCDHLALRGDETDLQLWVAQGAQPLPRRLVITYKREDGRPQFWAQFSEWNLAPEVPDALFVFTPPAGAAKIVFAVQQRMQPGAAQEKGR
jgi:hypothetical protein